MSQNDGGNEKKNNEINSKFSNNHTAALKYLYWSTHVHFVFPSTFLWICVTKQTIKHLYFMHYTHTIYMWIFFSLQTFNWKKKKIITFFFECLFAYTLVVFFPISVIWALLLLQAFSLLILILRLHRTLCLSLHSLPFKNTHYILKNISYQNEFNSNKLCQ